MDGGNSLWRHLRKDQYNHRHHHRGDPDTVGAEQPDADDGSDRGRKNIDQVVSQQDQADQPVGLA